MHVCVCVDVGVGDFEKQHYATVNGSCQNQATFRFWMNFNHWFCQSDQIIMKKLNLKKLKIGFLTELKCFKMSIFKHFVPIF